MKSFLNKNNKIFKYRKLFLFGIIFIIFLILLILPKDYFDSGKSVCVSVVLFNKKCYACGLTRATQHFIHLDIKKALEFNKLVIVTLPLLVYLMIKDFFKAIKELKK